jgi:hypothetical protein
MPSAAVGVSVAFGILHGHDEDSCICTMAGMKRVYPRDRVGICMHRTAPLSIQHINLSSSYTVC